MAKGFGYYIKRYCIVTVLPVLLGSVIYTDYSHTQEWKKRKALKNDEVHVYS